VQNFEVRVPQGLALATIVALLGVLLFLFSRVSTSTLIVFFLVAGGILVIGSLELPTRRLLVLLIALARKVAPRQRRRKI